MQARPRVDLSQVLKCYSACFTVKTKGITSLLKQLLFIIKTW